MSQDIVERLRSLATIADAYSPEAYKEAADTIESLRARVKELERPDFREMREMLRAMQAGELTVSRGIEILDMWHAGNWNDDMLPPVRQDLIEEDSMPVEIIESLRARVAELEAEADPEALHIAYLHGQADRNQQLAAKDQRIAELEAENELLENKVMARDAELWGRTQEILSCKDQLAAKALTIKTMRTVLENFIDSHEECTDFDGFTAQIVSIDDYHEAQEALALPDNSTEVLREWLDSVMGEPVAYIDAQGMLWRETTTSSDMPLYRKPEIK